MNQWRLVSGFSLLFVANAAFAEGEIPQMDQSWYANQLFWLAISFGLLFLLVSRYIAPTIGKVLATRENAITEAIREAERAKREAESTQGGAASTGQQAHAKAAEQMAKAQAQNTAEATQAFAKLDRELASKAAHASAQLDDALKKAEAGIEAAAQSLAQTITEKLLGQAEAVEATGPKLKLAVKR